jgi:hypothetical protein
MNSRLTCPKKKKKARDWWLTPVTLVAQEAEIRMRFEASPGNGL